MQLDMIMECRWKFYHVSVKTPVDIVNATVHCTVALQRKHILIQKSPLKEKWNAFTMLTH